MTEDAKSRLISPLTYYSFGLISIPVTIITFPIFILIKLLTLLFARLGNFCMSKCPRAQNKNEREEIENSLFLFPAFGNGNLDQITNQCNRYLDILLQEKEAGQNKLHALAINPIIEMLIKKKRLTEAITICQKYLILAPTRYAVFAYLGQCYEKLQDREKAIGYYQSYLDNIHLLAKCRLLFYLYSLERYRRIVVKKIKKLHALTS